VEILIPLAILFGFFWFFVLLPQRRRASTHTEMQDSLAPGDEIITAGGLHGTVVAIEDDVLEVEIARNTVVRLDRRAVAAIVSPEEAEEEVEEEPEALPQKSVSPDDG
jgi:preprotein translocase subunit YajC